MSDPGPECLRCGSHDVRFRDDLDDLFCAPCAPHQERICPDVPMYPLEETDDA